jgi:hypothetical protein
MDADFNSVWQAFQGDINKLTSILSISVENRICHGFAHGHVNAECGVLANSGSTHEFSYRRGRRGDRFNSAGQT